MQSRPLRMFPLPLQSPDPPSSPLTSPNSSPHRPSSAFPDHSQPPPSRSTPIQPYIPSSGPDPTLPNHSTPLFPPLIRPPKRSTSGQIRRQPFRPSSPSPQLLVHSSSTSRLARRSKRAISVLPPSRRESSVPAVRADSALPPSTPRVSSARRGPALLTLLCVAAGEARTMGGRAGKVEDVLARALGLRKGSALVGFLLVNPVAAYVVEALCTGFFGEGRVKVGVIGECARVVGSRYWEAEGGVGRGVGGVVEGMCGNGCARFVAESCVREVGTSGFESVVLSVAAMGFLCKFVDIIGVKEENWAGRAAWKSAGVERGAGQGRTGKSIDKSSSGGRLSWRGASLWHGLNAKAKRRLTLRGAKEPEVPLLRRVPQSAMGQKEYIQDVMGFYPYWLGGISSKKALRSVVGILDGAILIERELNVALKALMCLVSAQRHGDHMLAAQFAYLSYRFGANEDEIAQTMALHFNPLAFDPANVGLTLFGPFQSACLLLAYCSHSDRMLVIPRAQVPVSGPVVRALKSVLSPEAIAEGVTTVAIYEMIRRLISARPAVRLEPVVQQFACSVVGRRLKLYNLEYRAE